MNMLRYYTPPVYNSFNKSLLNQLLDETNMNAPKTNIVEHENQITIEMAIPGFSKEQIEIRFENDKLTIKGNATTQSDEELKWISKEFQLKSFEKSFIIAPTMNTDDIQAQFRNGILYVSISKKEEIKAKAPKEIMIG